MGFGLRLLWTAASSSVDLRFRQYSNIFWTPGRTTGRALIVLGAVPSSRGGPVVARSTSTTKLESASFLAELVSMHVCAKSASNGRQLTFDNLRAHESVARINIGSKSVAGDCCADNIKTRSISSHNGCLRSGRFEVS